MQSQDKNSPNSSFHCIALLFAFTLVSSSLLIFYLRSKKIRSKLRDYALPSKNTKPEVSYAGTSFCARIPKNTARNTLFGYGPLTRVSEIEILLLNRGNQEGDKDDRRQFTLTKEYPFHQLLIIPEKPYGYKWRSREDGLSWSEWSEEFISFISQPVPFRILPGTPSRERCSEIIKMIQQGVDFNIGLIGKTGAGKSEFTNRLAAAIQGSWDFAANASPDGLTTTQCLTEHKLLSGKVCVYDMPGWEDNFNLNLLPLILKGQLDEVTVSRLKPDSPDAACSDASFAQKITGGKPMPKMDIVLFIMSAINPFTAARLILLQISIFLENRDIPCIGILTKVDNIGSEDDLPISSERFYEDSRVIAQCKQVPFNVKFPLANPPTSWELKPEVDELMLQILRTAQEMSQADASKL